jgi:hypothetical protein
MQFSQAHTAIKSEQRYILLADDHLLNHMAVTK